MTLPLYPLSRCSHAAQAGGAALLCLLALAIYATLACAAPATLAAAAPAAPPATQAVASSATDMAARIAAALNHSSALPRRSGSDHGAAKALAALYARNGNQPLWSHGGHPSTQAVALLHELQGADRYGLQPRDYAADALAQQRDPAQFDVLATAAALRFVSDLHYGRVDPAAAGFKLLEKHVEIDLGATVAGLAQRSDLRAGIAAVEPPFHHYQLLKEALARYLKLQDQEALRRLPSVPPRLKDGDTWNGAPALRRLLVALGDLPAADAAPDSDLTYDTKLDAGLRRYQARHGLTVDGLPGKATWAALTTPMAQRVRQIDLTLERWRWLTPFRSPPIIVNIPQFRLFAFDTNDDRAKDILQMDVIVGRAYPRTQTPVFESEMRYLVFRPYWDVPAGITRREMLPKIRANPAYLQRERLQLVNGPSDNSPVVPATPENIAALAAGKLRLRQLPGKDNALGLIKFKFPNSYDVYLHSTPAQQLFQRSERAFSHGCIRVEDPVALAVQVLKNEPGNWTAQKVRATLDGNATSLRVNLTHPINVLILYGTVLATEAGPVMFFADVYGYDRRLEKQLGLAPVAR
ncbi:MAG: L,D-transpeptidase family protein [Proteobacteria bacterium]|nr:L,D-transpeptidase family protein [Pseudomonadota bacterium]